MARALGWSLLWGGALLSGWFFKATRDAEAPVRTDRPMPRLTTEGPFVYARNPGYLCLAMIYAGISVLRNSLWAILPPTLALHLVQREVIGREERYLERIFISTPQARDNIPRPATRAVGLGVLFGEGVSVGVARGPAKVLSRVGEKPVLPGEVLVARATDPGWTPLFVGAEGIVLETGGSFQHGALVAREYGKPCVVGIEDATERISDGQGVELDGEAGTVTLVSDPPESEG